MTVYATTDTKKGRTGIAPTYLQTTLRFIYGWKITGRFAPWTFPGATKLKIYNYIDIGKYLTQLNSTGDYGRRCLTPLCPHH